MAEEVLIYLTLIIGVAAFLTIIARIIKQPPIIAYLIAGILVGPAFFGLIGPNAADPEIIQIFGRIGVALLLFIVGLSLDFRVLKEVGKVATLAGTGEVLVTATAGFLISLALGFSFTPALYLAAAIAFSSTVLVVKILSDKKELNKLHGRIALGILIIEDFIAALVLMIIPIIKSGNLEFILAGLIKIIGIIIAVFLLSTFVLNRFLNFLARSPETLFLFSISWALLLAAAFNYLGLSLEIGALIAGMAFASSKYTLDLSGKIKPLRDFFVVLLFVFFGSQLVGPLNSDLIINSLIFSTFILIGKPIIVMTFTSLFGYKKRTSFLVGSSLAQISEFSLILVLLGFNLGYIDQNIMNLAILTSVITIGISSYTIHHSHTIFDKLSKMLNIFERKRGVNEKEMKKKKSYRIILFGYHRLGYKILQTIKKMKVPFLVVDHNPKVILALGKEGIDCVYGDAGDKDFLEEIDLDKAELIISTIPEEQISLTILEKLKEIDSKASFIGTADQPRSALDLYNEGADYVILPHHLGGQYVSEMMEKIKINKGKYRNTGKQHQKELKRAKDSSTFK